MWIIVILVVVLFVWYIKTKARNSNPIDSISYSGMLGFKIGDKMNFVLSRAKHLRLLTSKEFDKIIEDRDIMRDVMGMHSGFSVAKNRFNNVDELYFGTNDGKIVTSMLIEIDWSSVGLEDMKDILEMRLSRNLGNPISRGRGGVAWRKQAQIVALCVEQDKLFISINDARFEIL